MLSKYASSFAFAMLISVNMHADHHHDRHEEKVEIKIDTGHCHQTKRSLAGKFAAGAVQFTEANAFKLSTTGSVIYAYLAANHPRFKDRHIPVALVKAFSILVFGGWSISSISRIIMSQCNIERI